MNILKSVGCGVRVLAVASTLALVCPVLAAQKDPCAGPERLPNIIFVLTDDQDVMLQSMDYMPNVKALLADQGATFSNFFVPLSLCCPSRTGILRGQFPHNHKIWANEPPYGGFQKAYADNLESATVATALQKAGYRTFFFGKYLNGYPATANQTYVPPGWDDWYSPSGGDPYSEYNYQLNSDGNIVNHGNQPSDYLTDVMSAEAVNFIKNTAQQTSPPPFFMHITPFAPHRPSTPAPRHVGLFPTAQAPRTPSFNEADISDKPAYVQQLPLLTDADIAAMDEEYRLRLESLQAVDEMVAAIVNTLQSTGLLANTYIFFTSDNGYHMGQHRFLAGKYTPYETDIRVPLIVRGPDVPSAIRIDQFTGNVDLAATFAELGGATLKVPTDGRSLAPLIRGEIPAAWRQAFLIEQIAGDVSPLRPTLPVDRQAEPPDTQDLVMGTRYPGHTGYRADTYKYVEYDTGEKELYFFGTDPDEMANKASVADPIFLTAASTYLASLKGCQGPGCAAADAIVPPSPVAADITYTPVQPTDTTPVTFTGTGSGTPPYAFSWDLGGQPATGPRVTRTFPAGTYSITLRVIDGTGATDTDTISVTVGRSVVITSLKASASPFHVTIAGTGFKPGCSVRVNGIQVPTTKFVRPTQVVARGTECNAMFPEGVPVQVTVANTDGTAALPFSYTR